MFRSVLAQRKNIFRFIFCNRTLGVSGLWLLYNIFISVVALKLLFVYKKNTPAIWIRAPREYFVINAVFTAVVAWEQWWLGSSGGSLVATPDCKLQSWVQIQQSPQPTVDCQSLDGLLSGMALCCRLSSEGRQRSIYIKHQKQLRKKKKFSQRTERWTLWHIFPLLTLIN